MTHRQPHAGVMYLRLGEYADQATKFKRVEYVLSHHVAQLDQILVLTRRGVVGASSKDQG